MNVENCLVLEGDPKSGFWLSELDSVTGIPYTAELRTNGHSNYGYFDLRVRPESIESIPEIRDVPDLRRLIEFLNCPDSVFSSVGCEKATMPFHHGELSTEMNGYIQVVFADVGWNRNKDNFVNLYRRFCLYSNPQIGAPMRNAFNFEINKANFHQLKVAAWSVAFWVHGFGRSESEAKERWSSGIRFLTQFLKQENETLKKIQETTRLEARPSAEGRALSASAPIDGSKIKNSKTAGTRDF